MIEREFVKHLVKRLGRLDAYEVWAEDLNPTQKTVLEYLFRANRFSRSPSHVADFLGSTRGTVSQTLKALARKGFVEESSSARDGRSITYQLTSAGRDAVTRNDVLGHAMEGITATELGRVATTLRRILDQVIAENGQRSFGLCHKCTHLARKRSGTRCLLFDEPLDSEELTQICHQQDPRA